MDEWIEWIISSKSEVLLKKNRSQFNRSKINHYSWLFKMIENAFEKEEFILIMFSPNIFSLEAILSLSWALIASHCTENSKQNPEIMPDSKVKCSFKNETEKCKFFRKVLFSKITVANTN